jgi:hypothetical protein
MAVIRVNPRIGLVGHARGVNSRSRVVLVTSKASSRVVNSGINAVGCGGRVRSGAIRRGIVSVHPGLLSHAGCCGGVAGRDVCVSGCARRTVTGRGGCSAIVVGAQTVGASARRGGLVGVIGRGDVRGGVGVVGGGGGGRLSVIVLVVELIGDLVHETHDGGLVVVLVLVFWRMCWYCSGCCWY